MLGRDAPSRARRQIRAGDVIFATIRPTLKRIAVVPHHLDGAVCSTAFFVFRPRPILDGRFLYYHLFTNAFSIAMESLQAGASYPAVTDAQIKAQRISFPPLPQQKRIIAILDEVFEEIGTAVANAEKNLTNTRGLFESRLNLAFSRQGKTWPTKSLGSIASISYGFTAKASFGNDGPKFLRITDIRDDGVDWTTVPTCQISSSEFKRHKLHDKDIVFTRTGATTGKSFLVSCPPISVPASYLIRCRLTNHDTLASYVAKYFQTKAYWEHIAYGTTGSAQGGFNASKLAELAIPIPSHSEQQRLVVQLDDLAAQIRLLSMVYQQKLERLAELKQAILQKAFAGELTARSADALQEAAD